MGYTLSIGQARIWYDNTTDMLCEITVEPVHGTPEELGIPEPYLGCWRDTGYGYWHEFTEATGLNELFYGQGWSRENRSYKFCSDGFHREVPLLHEHPGAQAIGPKDLAFITQRRRAYEAACGEPPSDENGENGNHFLYLLIWLEHWFTWALKNCDKPVFGNR